MVANQGELNNNERNKESTARGGMTKMVRLFRTKKLKLELLNASSSSTCSSTCSRCYYFTRGVPTGVAFILGTLLRKPIETEDQSH